MAGMDAIVMKDVERAYLKQCVTKRLANVQTKPVNQGGAAKTARKV